MFQEAFLAKITRPKPSNVYLRENFFSILDKCRKKPVIWLSAPPGTGKTTLISSYIESRDLRCLWYQVDSADRDLSTFFHYLGLAAAKTNPNKKEPLPHLTPEYQLGIQIFTRKYFAKLFTLLGKNSLIIFDNYQEVSAESILHEVVYDGLDIMPNGINVIMISRTGAPPILSRMRLAQSMEVVTWDELRLTVDEVKGIASQRGNKISNDDIRKMLATTEGWAAGVVLMLDSLDRATGMPIDKFKPDSIFNYFAEGLFNKFSQEIKDFLLITSILPIMTAEMAKELTGNNKAAAIISHLVDINYFIQAHGSDQIYFQYHHLFRDFLVARLKNEADNDEITKIEYKAASLLVKSGRIDDAIVLYYSLGAWDPLVSLILKEAPAMLGQGRYQTLKEWLTLLPEYVTNEQPWLLYWKGSCYLPFEQYKSRLFFEKAFEAFYEEKNPNGIFQSWCGIVEAAVHGFDDFKILDHWIDSMDGLLAEYPVLPSKEIEGRVSLCMFMALSFRAPQHLEINVWVNKTCDLIKVIPNQEVLAVIILYLIDYFLWTGEMEKADLLVNLASKKLRNKCNSPMALISIKLTEALNAWYHGRSQICIAAVSDGLKIAGAKGVNVFNYFLFEEGAISALTSGDIKKAEEYLEEARLVLDDRKRFCASYYHHLVACCKLLRKDLSGAFESEKLSFDLARETGSPFAEGMTRTGIALLHYELGAPQKAALEILKARELAIKTGSGLIEFVSYIFDAYFALDGGNRSEAVEKLKNAMSLGSKKGLMNFHMWRPDIMARLCLLSLDEGIEVEYVKRLILQRDIFPDDIDQLLEEKNWPWRIKIYTMNGFNIIKDGIPLRFNTKAPRKSIDVLKLMISLGGRDVPESRILDTLWDDSDGDAAHVAFTTILKRLRHILGFDDAIVLRNGCLTINQRYCWVDALVFMTLIAKAEATNSNSSSEESSIRLFEGAIKLYNARYTISPADNHWSILFYENIKSKYIRAIIKLGAYLEKTGETKKAVECYRKGIENEPLSEELYNRLLACLLRSGLEGEALALYKSMTKVFKEVLGIEPSPNIMKIFKNLSANQSSKPYVSFP